MPTVGTDRVLFDGPIDRNPAVPVKAGRNYNCILLSSSTMGRVNPATGEKLDSIDQHTDEDVDAVLSRATETFEEWRTVPITEREQLIEQVAEILRKNEDEYAELMTKEMGKPIDAAVAEVEKCAWVCEYYAENAGRHLADEQLRTEAEAKTFVSYEPMGPIFAIMPWNFPLWQVFRFAAPNITAGNVGVLKHAANVPGCAQVIEEIFRDAGYPEGVFQTLIVGSDAAQDAIEDERIAAVTITGSEGAGRAVAETAGSEIKKTVLELGGSDPFVVLSDADLDAAAEIGAQARLQNNGESCIAAKRFIVEETIYDAFLERFIAEMESYEVGDPMDEDTDIGPQAREDLMEDLHDQIERTVEAGATVELGGEPLDRDGFY